MFMTGSQEVVGSIPIFSRAGIQDKNLFTTEVLDEHSILKRNGKIVYHFEGYIKPFKLDSGHLYFTKLNETTYTVYILIL